MIYFYFLIFLCAAIVLGAWLGNDYARHLINNGWDASAAEMHGYSAATKLIIVAIVGATIGLVLFG